MKRRKDVDAQDRTYWYTVNLLRDVLIFSCFLAILILVYDIFHRTSSSSSSSNNIPHIYPYIIQEATFISPNITYDPILINPAFSTIFSLNVNATTNTVQDMSIHNLSINTGGGNNPYLYPIVRTPDRGVVLSEPVSVTWTSVIDSPTLNQDLGWTLIFWISIPTINAATSLNYTLIPSLLFYPWSMISATNGQRILLNQSYIPLYYINEWTMVSLVYDISTLTMYWNNNLTLVQSVSPSNPFHIPSPFTLEPTAGGVYLDNITLLIGPMTSDYISQVYSYTLGLTSYQTIHVDIDEDTGFIYNNLNVDANHPVRSASSMGQCWNNNPYNSVCLDEVGELVCNCYNSQNNNCCNGNTLYHEPITVVSLPFEGEYWNIPELICTEYDTCGGCVFYENPSQCTTSYFPGCVEHTTTMWVQLDVSVLGQWGAQNIYNGINQLGNVGFYDQLLNAFSNHLLFWGCGLNVWSYNVIAIEPNKKTHVAITYQQGRNDWYIDGTHVFSWYAYSIPEPKPFIDGILQVAPLNGVSIASTNFYCGRLTQAQILDDMSSFDTPDPKISTYDMFENLPNLTPMPEWENPFLYDPGYLAAYYCTFSDPSTFNNQDNVTSILPSTYIRYYINQQNGSDTNGNNGTSPHSALATPKGMDWLQSMVLSYPITSEDTMWQSLMQWGGVNSTIPWCNRNSVGCIPPTFAPNVFGSNSQCNAWSFTPSTTVGNVQLAYVPDFPTHCSGNNVYGQAPRGGPTLSLWIQVSSITGIVNVGPSNFQSGTYIITITTAIQTYSYPNGTTSTTVYMLFACPNYSSYQNGETSFNQACTYALLNYQQKYYITTSMYIAEYGQVGIWVNGVLNMATLTTASGTGLANVYPVTTILYVNSQHHFTGYIGGMVLSCNGFQYAQTGTLMYNYVSQPSLDACLVSNELGVEIEMCYGDRYFASTGIQIDVGTPNLPIIIQGRDCTPEDPTDDVHPHLSGMGLLPQTQDIGWEIVEPYLSPMGIEWHGVLRYPLHTLFVNQPASNPYLSVDPLNPSTTYMGFTYYGPWSFSYQPTVQGTQYNTPKMPNIDSPLAPFGRFMNQSLVVTAIDTSDFSQTFSTVYTNLTAGSWCFATYHQMFQDNTTQWYKWWINSTTGLINSWATTFLNGAVAQGLSFPYQSFQYPAEATWNYGGGHFDCPTWYNSVYNLSDPYSPWISWNDSQIMIMDRLFSQVGQYNFTNPASVPGGSAFDPPGNAYGTWILGYLQSAGAPLMSPNQKAVWEGYISSNNGTLGMQMQDHIQMFDSPGEYYLNTTDGYLYLFPWNDLHRQGLLLRSNYFLSQSTAILRDRITTENWTTVHLYNIPYAIASSSTNGAYRQIQELEISGYGYYMPGPQTSSWAIQLLGNGGARVLNTSIHHVTAGIQLTVHGFPVLPTHSFIINTTVANLTIIAGNAMFSCLQSPLGGCWACSAYGEGICSLMNSTCFFGCGGTGNNYWNHGRDIQMLHNYGESVWVDNSPFMNERMMVNQTLQMYLGDGGDDYGPANQWILKYSIVDGPYHAWSNQINWGGMFTQGGGGDTRIMYYEDTSGWYIHANKFLNGYGDGNGLYDSHGYQSVSGPDWTSEGLFHATGNIWQRGQLRFFYGPDGGDGDPNMIFPASYESTLGRPYGFWSNFAYYDGFLIGETTAKDFPVKWGMYQGYSTMWTWSSTNPSNSQFANPVGCIWNFSMGYALVEYNGLSNFTNSSLFQIDLLSLAPGAPPEMLADVWTNTIIDNAASDVYLALENSSPFPVFGFEQTLSAAETWMQGIDNEAQINRWITEPTIWHIIKSQTPYWFVPASIASPQGGQMWWDSYYSYTGSSEYPFLINTSINPCTGTNNDCDSSLLFNYSINYLTGLAHDTVFHNSIISCSNPSNTNPFGSFYSGVSYDPLFGAVIDSTRGVNNEVCSWDNFMPSIINGYTITLWFFQPAFPYGINFDVDPNNCSPGAGCTGSGHLLNSIYQVGCTGTFNSEQYIYPYSCLVSPFTTTYTNNNTIGVWAHIALAQNPVTGFTSAWINGVPQLYAALGSNPNTGLAPLGQYGGANGLFTLLNKYAALQIYAGVLSNTAVMNLYVLSSSQHTYNGPSFSGMTSNTVIFQLYYQSSTQQFMNGISAYPFSIGGMGPFIPGQNNIVNMSTSDPAGVLASNVPIINAYTAFILPIPIMNNWQVSLTTQFLGIPIIGSCYTFFDNFNGATSLHFFSTEYTSLSSTGYSSNPLTIVLVPDFAHTCTLKASAANNLFYYVCVLGGLYQPRGPGGVAPVYNTSACTSGKMVFIANSWYNLSFQFNAYTSQIIYSYMNSSTPSPLTYTLSFPSSASSYLQSTHSLSFARPPDYISTNSQRGTVLSYCGTPIVIGGNGINNCYAACSSCIAPNIVFVSAYYQNITIVNLS